MNMEQEFCPKNKVSKLCWSVGFDCTPQWIYLAEVGDKKKKQE